MYGRLTRAVTEWRPDRLVCKRFNVPNPYAGEEKDGEQEDDKEILNEKTMRDLRDERDRRFNERTTNFAEKSNESEDAPKGVEELKEIVEADKVNEKENEEEGEVEKPSMDLFKAIFADSDDDEEEDHVGTKLEPVPVEPTFSKPETQDRINKSALELKYGSGPIGKEDDFKDNAMEPKPLFKPVFKKKELRHKELSDLAMKKKQNSSVGLLSFEDDEDGGLQIKPSSSSGSRDYNKDEALKRELSDTEQNSSKKHKKSKKDKKVKKKKKAKYDSSSSEEEWVEASSSNQSYTRPKAADFL
jgi:G patch domain-containing protein 1